MRIFKKTMLAVLMVFAVVFVNGCIYVFGGVKNIDYFCGQKFRAGACIVTLHGRSDSG